MVLFFSWYCIKCKRLTSTFRQILVINCKLLLQLLSHFHVASTYYWLRSYFNISCTLSKGRWKALLSHNQSLFDGKALSPYLTFFKGTVLHKPLFPSSYSAIEAMCCKRLSISYLICPIPQRNGS